jgi:hypothetical protein
VLEINDENTIAELKTFVRDDNGSTHGSPHDDCVMSLAIANQMLKFVWHAEYRPKIEAPIFSFDWFASKVEKPKAQKFVIGSFNVP